MGRGRLYAEVLGQFQYICLTFISKCTILKHALVHRQTFLFSDRNVCFRCKHVCNHHPYGKIPWLSSQWRDPKPDFILQLHSSWSPSVGTGDLETLLAFYRVTTQIVCLLLLINQERKWQAAHQESYMLKRWLCID